jgi:hypothetical protein
MIIQSIAHEILKYSNCLLLGLSHAQKLARNRLFLVGLSKCFINSAFYQVGFYLMKSSAKFSPAVVKNLFKAYLYGQ